MKTAGIICEYNPFHNGHLYHINQTKKQADAVVCVMSGSFVQRGLPAVCDKFSRADAAVRHGADLVVELPTVFALSSAEKFAYGGVSILGALGFVDMISFGAESENFRIVDEENKDFKNQIRAELDLGLSYAAAKANAAAKIFGIKLSDKPNDILAYEYMKNIKKLGLGIEPLIIKRRFNDYHSNLPIGKYASASYIREHLADAKKYTPELPEISEITDFEKYKLASLAHLRCVDAAMLKETYGCGEGLENRLKQAANDAESFEEFCELAGTKRYPSGRILRLAACSMLGIKKGNYKPEYIRILSMSRTGCGLLHQNAIGLPVITNLSKQQIPSKQLEIDIKAGNLRSLFTKNTKGGSDFRRSPRVISCG